MIRKTINNLAAKLADLDYLVGNVYIKISSSYRTKVYESELYIDLKAYNPENKTLLLFYNDNKFDEIIFEYIQEYMKNSKCKEIKAYRIEENGKIYPEYIIKEGILKDYKNKKEYKLDLL